MGDEGDFWKDVKAAKKAAGLPASAALSALPEHRLLGQTLGVAGVRVPRSLFDVLRNAEHGAWLRVGKVDGMTNLYAVGDPHDNEHKAARQRFLR